MSFYPSNKKIQSLNISHIYPDSVRPQSSFQFKESSFLVKKISLSQKEELKSYQNRRTTSSNRSPRVTLNINTSEPYAIVKIENYQSFSVLWFDKLALFQKISTVIQILEGVKDLVKTYSFFYLTDQMIHIDRNGKIIIWINGDMFCNYRQMPIQYGPSSEQAFIRDFKLKFSLAIQENQEYFQIKTIQDLLSFCKKNAKQRVSKSLYLEEIPQKHFPLLKTQSHQQQNKNYISNCFELNNSSSFYSQKQNLGLKKAISFSYLEPNSLNEEQNKITSSISSSRTIFHNQSSSNLHSKMPKISFSYSCSPVKAKKEERTFFKKQNIFEIQKGKESPSSPLKASYPYKTNHTMFTLKSTGASINFNFNESSNLDKAGLCFKKEAHEASATNLSPEIINDMHISEEGSNDVEMELENLFESNIPEDQNSQEKIEQLQKIMEEFQTLLG